MFRCSDVMCFIQINQPNQPIVLLFRLSINFIAEEARKTIAMFQAKADADQKKVYKAHTQKMKDLIPGFKIHNLDSDSEDDEPEKPDEEPSSQ